MLKTPEGASWKVLLLPHQPRLTLETLGRIRDLVKEGATVVGRPSAQNASLSGGGESDQRFQALLAECWGDAPKSSGDRRLGAGRLIWGNDLGTILAKLAIAPDVSGASAATWCHRTANGTDIYFVAADRLAPFKANLGFRSQGRPELWDPLTGTSHPIAIFHQEAGRTVIPMDLPAAGSAFVIFRPGAAEPVCTQISRDGVREIDAEDAKRVDKGAPQPVQGLTKSEIIQPWVNDPSPVCELLGTGKQLLAWDPGKYQLAKNTKPVASLKLDRPHTVPVTGPWSLSFPKGWGAPEKIELPILKAWSELAEPETRAFSGSATYACKVELEAPAAESRVMLDLGRVEVIADVAVNGKPVAKLWAAPFRADITPYVVAGSNRIEVKVTSTWFNRLAYDAGLPETTRKTWTIHGPDKGAGLQPAGLIGPVVVRIGQVGAVAPL